VSCKSRGPAASLCFADLPLTTAAARVASLRFAVDRGGVACEFKIELNGRFFPSFDALRREAGVMLGDVSSSESYSSASELDMGVLGRLEGASPFLPAVAWEVRLGADCVREGLLMDFRAPGLATFRCKLTVVSLVDLRAPLAV
jgi:hypothetical protein